MTTRQKVENMKKYLVNILLLILTAALASGCCFIPDDLIDGIIDRTDRIIIPDEEEATKPEIVDHGTFTGVPMNTRVSSIPISGQAIDVDISGNYAYVTNDLGVLYIINISDRERPFITGKCRDIDSANIVIVEGDMAYVSYTEWIAGERDYYTECGFKIVDISDKENPEIIGDFISGDQDKKSIFGLYIYNGYAYCNTTTYDTGSERNTFEIVDISDKTSPLMVGELELDGSPANVTVSGNTAFININYYDYEQDQYSENSQLVLVDINDKEKPEIRSLIDVPANSWGIFHENDIICLSSHLSEDDAYSESMIQLVDVSGDAPDLLGSIPIPGGGWELDMTGGFLYVSDLTGGVYTVDINNPDEPFIAGRLNTSGTSYDITLMGNFGYIADGFGGLVIMGLSDEESDEDYEPAKQDHVNLPPHAVLDIYGDRVGEYYITGTPIVLSGANSFDPESKEIIFSWSISGHDMLPDEEINDITFDEPGFYEITLDVSDGDIMDSITEKIHIADINEPIEDIDPHSFNIEIEYILENNGQIPLKDIECLMRVPLSYEPYQLIEDMTVNVPIADEIYDNHRNKLLRFIIDEDLLPGQRTSVLASFKVKVNEFDYSNISQDLDYDQDDPDLYYYTREDLYIDSESPAITETVSRLIGDEEKPVRIAGILYDYIAGNLYYDYDRAENREYEFMTASEILDIGKGVCADYSILYTAMLRAAGIPARLAAGIPVYTILYETDREIDIGHAWVEVKIPGHGWVPVDITTEEDFWTSNYFLDIVTERGPGYIYEHTTMDWGSYYYDGFHYEWDGDGISPVEQSFIFRVKDLFLEDIVKD